MQRNVTISLVLRKAHLLQSEIGPGRGAGRGGERREKWVQLKSWAKFWPL